MSKKLKLSALPQSQDYSGNFVEWYAHLFTANRVQYILTTEAKTLFSVVLYGRGITDDDIFIKDWLRFLSDYLSDIDRSRVFKTFIGPNTGQFRLAKTSSRSVLGSMNDMISTIKFTLQTEDLSPYDLSKMINSTPFKTIDYQTPIACVDQLPYLRLI